MSSLENGHSASEKAKLCTATNLAGEKGNNVNTIITENIPPTKMVPTEYSSESEEEEEDEDGDGSSTSAENVDKNYAEEIDTFEFEFSDFEEAELQVKSEFELEVFALKENDSGNTSAFEYKAKVCKITNEATEKGLFGSIDAMIAKYRKLKRRNEETKSNCYDTCEVSENSLTAEEHVQMRQLITRMTANAKERIALETKDKATKESVDSFIRDSTTELVTEMTSSENGNSASEKAKLFTATNLAGEKGNNVNTIITEDVPPTKMAPTEYSCESQEDEDKDGVGSSTSSENVDEEYAEEIGDYSDFEEAEPQVKSKFDLEDLTLKGNDSGNIMALALEYKAKECKITNEATEKALFGSVDSVIGKCRKLTRRNKEMKSNCDDAREVSEPTLDSVTTEEHVQVQQLITRMTAISEDRTREMSSSDGEYTPRSARASSSYTSPTARSVSSSSSYTSPTARSVSASSSDTSLAARLVGTSSPYSTTASTSESYTSASESSSSSDLISKETGNKASVKEDRSTRMCDVKRKEEKVEFKTCNCKAVNFFVEKFLFSNIQNFITEYREVKEPVVPKRETPASTTADLRPRNNNNGSESSDIQAEVTKPNESKQNIPNIDSTPVGVTKRKESDQNILHQNADFTRGDEVQSGIYNKDEPDVFEEKRFLDDKQGLFDDGKSVIYDVDESDQTRDEASFSVSETLKTKPFVALCFRPGFKWPDELSDCNSGESEQKAVVEEPELDKAVEEDEAELEQSFLSNKPKTFADLCLRRGFKWPPEPANCIIEEPQIFHERCKMDVEKAEINADKTKEDLANPSHEENGQGIAIASVLAYKAKVCKITEETTEKALFGNINKFMAAYRKLKRRISSKDETKSEKKQLSLHENETKSEKEEIVENENKMKSQQEEIESVKDETKSEKEEIEPDKDETKSEKEEIEPDKDGTKSEKEEMEPDKDGTKSEKEEIEPDKDGTKSEKEEIEPDKDETKVEDEEIALDENEAKSQKGVIALAVEIVPEPDNKSISGSDTWADAADFGELVKSISFGELILSKPSDRTLESGRFQFDDDELASERGSVYYDNSSDIEEDLSDLDTDREPAGYVTAIVDDIFDGLIPENATTEPKRSSLENATMESERSSLENATMEPERSSLQNATEPEKPSFETENVMEPVKASSETENAMELENPSSKTENAMAPIKSCSENDTKPKKSKSVPSDSDLDISSLISDMVEAFVTETEKLRTLKRQIFEAELECRIEYKPPSGRAANLNNQNGQIETCPEMVSSEPETPGKVITVENERREAKKLKSGDSGIGKNSADPESNGSDINDWDSDSEEQELNLTAEPTTSGYKSVSKTVNETVLNTCEVQDTSPNSDSDKEPSTIHTETWISDNDENEDTTKLKESEQILQNIDSSQFDTTKPKESGQTLQYIDSIQFDTTKPKESGQTLQYIDSIQFDTTKQKGSGQNMQNIDPTQFGTLSPKESEQNLLHNRKSDYAIIEDYPSCSVHQSSVPECLVYNSEPMAEFPETHNLTPKQENIFETLMKAHQQLGFAMMLIQDIEQGNKSNIGFDVENKDSRDRKQWRKQKQSREPFFESVEPVILERACNRVESPIRAGSQETVAAGAESPTASLDGFESDVFDDDDEANKDFIEKTQAEVLESAKARREAFEAHCRRSQLKWPSKSSECNVVRTPVLTNANSADLLCSTGVESQDSENESTVSTGANQAVYIRTVSEESIEPELLKEKVPFMANESSIGKEDGSFFLRHDEHCSVPLAAIFGGSSHIMKTYGTGETATVESASSGTLAQREATHSGGQTTSVGTTGEVAFLATFETEASVDPRLCVKESVETVATTQMALRNISSLSYLITVCLNAHSRSTPAVNLSNSSKSTICKNGAQTHAECKNTKSTGTQMRVPLILTEGTQTTGPCHFTHLATETQTHLKVYSMDDAQKSLRKERLAKLVPTRPEVCSFGGSQRILIQTRLAKLAQTSPEVNSFDGAKTNTKNTKSTGTQMKVSLILTEGTQTREPFHLTEGTETEATTVLTGSTQTKAPMLLTEGTQTKRPLYLTEGIQTKAPMLLTEGTQAKRPLYLTEGTQTKAPMLLTEGTQAKRPLYLTEETQTKAPMLMNKGTSTSTGKAKPIATQTGEPMLLSEGTQTQTTSVFSKGTQTETCAFSTNTTQFVRHVANKTKQLDAMSCSSETSPDDSRFSVNKTPTKLREKQKLSRKSLSVPETGAQNDKKIVKYCLSTGNETLNSASRKPAKTHFEEADELDTIEVSINTRKQVSLTLKTTKTEACSIETGKVVPPTLDVQQSQAKVATDKKSEKDVTCEGKIKNKEQKEAIQRGKEIEVLTNAQNELSVKQYKMATDETAKTNPHNDLYVKQAKMDTRETNKTLKPQLSATEPADDSQIENVQPKLYVPSAKQIDSPRPDEASVGSSKSKHLSYRMKRFLSHLPDVHPFINRAQFDTGVVLDKYMSEKAIQAMKRKEKQIEATSRIGKSMSEKANQGKQFQACYELGITVSEKANKTIKSPVKQFVDITKLGKSASEKASQAMEYQEKGVEIGTRLGITVSEKAGQAISRQEKVETGTRLGIAVSEKANQTIKGQEKQVEADKALGITVSEKANPAMKSRVKQFVDITRPGKSASEKANQVIKSQKKRPKKTRVVSSALNTGVGKQNVKINRNIDNADEMCFKGWLVNLKNAAKRKQAKYL